MPGRYQAELAWGFDVAYASATMAYRALILLSVIAFSACRRPPTAGDVKGSIVKIGDDVPSFSITTTEGAEFSTEKLKGKVILVNFFATWCPPCVAELPHVETELWQKYKDRGLALVAVGQGHSTEEVAAFKKTNKLTLPMAADPQNEVFAKFGVGPIPRNIVIGADGKIVFQSVGFSEAEFAQMVRAIQLELIKAR